MPHSDRARPERTLRRGGSPLRRCHGRGPPSRLPDSTRAVELVSPWRVPPSTTESSTTSQYAFLDSTVESLGRILGILLAQHYGLYTSAGRGRATFGRLGTALYRWDFRAAAN